MEFTGYALDRARQALTDGIEEADFGSGRQSADFGGVAIEELQAFEAGGVKLVVDVFGEV
jgi:hypothetical protein